MYSLIFKRTGSAFSYFTFFLPQKQNYFFFRIENVSVSQTSNRFSLLLAYRVSKQDVYLKPEKHFEILYTWKSAWVTKQDCTQYPCTHHFEVLCLRVTWFHLILLAWRSAKYSADFSWLGNQPNSAYFLTWEYAKFSLIITRISATFS